MTIGMKEPFTTIGMNDPLIPMNAVTRSKPHKRAWHLRRRYANQDSRQFQKFLRYKYEELDKATTQVQEDFIKQMKGTD